MLKLLIVTLLSTTYAFSQSVDTKSVSTKVMSKNNLQIKEYHFDYDQEADPYFEITKVVVEELPYITNSKSIEKSNIKSIIAVVDGVIAIGTKVWKIIDAGKPVSNINMANGVSVIPFKGNDMIDATFYEMENWSIPEAQSYRVKYKNGFGSSVISFTYTVIYQHSGQLDGKGAYLAGVNVIADDVEVSWGFDFSATSQFVQISNHGTKDNKIAGATFKVSYVAKSVLKEIKSSDTFHVMGNGKLIKY